MIDESNQIRERFEAAVKTAASTWFTLQLRDLVKRAPNVASSQQLRFAAANGLDSARRHELITKGLAEMVSLVLTISTCSKIERWTRNFDNYKNVCRKLAEMSQEWTPGPISVTSWMECGGNQAKQSQLTSCLAQEATRKYLDVVNKIFITAYFLSKKSMLVLKQNVSISTPFSFLPIDKLPMMREPQERRAHFTKDGDMLILSRNIQASTENVCLRLHSPNPDDTEPQYGDDTEPQYAEEMMTEPQPHQNEMKPQQMLDNDSNNEMRQPEDDEMLLNMVVELDHFVSTRLSGTKRNRKPELVQAVDTLLLRLQSMRRTMNQPRKNQLKRRQIIVGSDDDEDVFH